jgi:hypothetical protein
MTKRLLVVAGLVAASLAGFPSRAFAGWADWWDALDALSGPGPFHAAAPVVPLKFSCLQDGEVTPIWRATPDRNDPCLFFQFQKLKVDPKTPFSEVNATIVQAGLTFEQDPALEVGFGVGVANFTTTVGSTDYGVKNFIVSPRIVFKPLRLIPAWRRNPKYGVFQMHYRPVLRFGDIDGSDFGVPASTFSAGTEFLKGGSVFVFDLLELTRRR